MKCVYLFCQLHWDRNQDNKWELNAIRALFLSAVLTSIEILCSLPPKRAVECGFPGNAIVYAGVGKSDEEIRTALQEDIFCFNCESLPEIRIINELVLLDFVGFQTKTAENSHVCNLRTDVKMQMQE